ncbi:MAG: GcrA family cell cycle regulator [Planktomarina sp.]
MAWTEERVEILKRMWGEGQSASTIAKELGGVTRNAVIGKVHRLGLSNRAGTAAKAADTDAKKSAPEAKKAAPAAKAKAAPKPKADPAPEAPKAQTPEPKTEADVPVPRPMPPAVRKIIPAGQPLPPQPSANEISPEALEKVAEVEKTSKKISLMELTEKTCKWPIGDPATKDFWFCGLPSQAGKPYCEAHVGVAFQPMNSRRDRRK